MKTQSPLLMGAVIFTGNLSMQAFTTGSQHIDFYRAVALAILAAIVYYVVAPLLGANDSPLNTHTRVPVKARIRNTSGEPRERS